MAAYDAVVIGSGPAGLEAALNLQIRKKAFVLFGHENLSTKIEKAPKIKNYLGLPEITGRELQQRFREHLSQMGVELRAEQVSSVLPLDGTFHIATNRDVCEARTVILCSGTASSGSFPGEERLLGRGVGYCATCDAPLYKGKDVAILGYGDESVHEANFVAEIARTVYYIPMGQSGAELREGIRVVRGKVREILGEQLVSGLLLEGETLEVDGVFVLRESLAPQSLIPGIETDGPFIRVDADMRTSIPGCFAAGDCTGKPHQYMRAAGQGQVAALSAVSFLDQAR